jgi:putative membrane protein
VFTALALAAHPGGPGFGFGWLFFLIPLFWIGLIILFVSLARRRWSRGGWGPGHYAGHPGHGGYGPWGGAARSAEGTLAERFAQGDIDEKEYRARLEVLRANNTFTSPAK